MTTNNKRHLEIIRKGDEYNCTVLQPAFGIDVIMDTYVADTISEALVIAFIYHGIDGNFRLKS